MRLVSTLPLILPVLIACRSEPNSEGPVASPEPAEAQGAAPRAAPQPVASDAQLAAIGKAAPDFTLPDLDGKPVKLSSFRGKTVVLEWYNPDCPFVRKSHAKGSLVDTAKRLTSPGVVWLAVNSGAPGKQGAGREKNLAGKQAMGLQHPILLDESGAVGKLYGAKRTPHLFVVDGEGTLVYRGAVDNSPDGEGESPSDGKLVRYVEAALDALTEKRPVSPAETEAYGCSVKYAN
jgi:peroxiredoxin